MNERDEALADVAATIEDVTMLLIDLSERLHGHLEQDEAEAEAPQYGPGDADCRREPSENPWRVKEEMRRELQRLVWMTEGTDPKPLPPRRRP